MYYSQIFNKFRKYLLFSTKTAPTFQSAKDQVTRDPHLYVCEVWFLALREEHKLCLKTKVLQQIIWNLAG
jgi:hypothetical protein